MDMQIIKTENRLCTCCMEKHEVKTVLVREQATFKQLTVSLMRVIYTVIWLTSCMRMKRRCRKMIYVSRMRTEKRKDF